MDVDFIFQVAGIGIIVAVLNQLLQRSGREEQAMLTTLAGLIVVLIMVVPIISLPPHKLHYQGQQRGHPLRHRHHQGRPQSS